jgi:hypothetical protein
MLAGGTWLLKRAVFALGLALFTLPMAALAQDTPDAGPSPLPAEHYLMVDGLLGGKSYNELSNGATNSGFGVKGAYELPIVGHNWVAQIDFKSLSYKHAANGSLVNGVTFACPANDPGCVTPIGYRTYNAVFSPGPVNYLNAFTATDTTTQIGLGSKIARVERYYLSVGYMIRGFNYLNYPTMSGLGFGLDKLPDVDRPISVYGSFWAYFNVGAKYTGIAAPGLGAFSNYPFTVAYRMFTYRLGATVNLPHTPLFFDIAGAGDRADVSASGPSSAVHGSLALGIGSKF